MPEKLKTTRVTTLAIIVAAIAPFGGGAIAHRWVAQHLGVAIVIGLLWEAAVVAVQFSRSVVGGVLDRWRDRFTARIDAWTLRTFTRQGQKYRHYTNHAVETLRIVGVATRGTYSLELKRVFVELRLLSSPPHSASGSLLTDNAHPPVSAPARTTIWALINPESGPAETRLVILGGPGSGKTTLLEHCTYVLSSSRKIRKSHHAPPRKLPALITLRKVTEQLDRNPRLSITELIRSTLPEALQGPPGWIEAKAANGSFVVMVDGVDEAGSLERRSKVMEWLDKQILAFPKNIYVITSRPYGYRDNPLDVASVVQVLSFSEQQVRSFVRNWYRAVEERSAGQATEAVIAEADRLSSSFIEALYDVPGLLDLTVNPLLLTMATQVHYYRGALPVTRVELYFEICDTLLGRRDIAKGLPSILTTAQKKSILQKVALAMMKARRRTVSKGEALTFLDAILPAYSTELNPDIVLAMFEESTGLYLQLEADIWAFAHLTFQEYLAACELLETQQAPSRWDSWWYEVIAFWSAQTNPSDTVEAVMSSTSEDDSGSLASIAVCIENARELRPDIRTRFERRLGDELSALSPVAFEVVSRRRWRSVVRIASDVYCRSTALSEEEYEFFVHDRRLLGETRVVDVITDRSSDGPSGHRPARGVRSEDVEAYLEWLGEGKRLGMSIRLPTQAEVALLPNALTEGLAVWVAEQPDVQRRLDEVGVLTSAGSPPLKLTENDVLYIMESDLESLSDYRRTHAQRAKEGDVDDIADQLLELGGDVLDHLLSSLKSGAGVVGAAFTEWQDGSDSIEYSWIERSWEFMESMMRDPRPLGLLSVDLGMCVRLYERCRPDFAGYYDSDAGTRENMSARVAELISYALVGASARSASQASIEVKGFDRCVARCGLYLLFVLQPWSIEIAEGYVADSYRQYSVDALDLIARSAVTAISGLDDIDDGKRRVGRILYWAIASLWTLMHFELRAAGKEQPWETIALIRDES